MRSIPPLSAARRMPCTGGTSNMNRKSASPKRSFDSIAGARAATDPANSDSAPRRNAPLVDTSPFQLFTSDASNTDAKITAATLYRIEERKYSNNDAIYPRLPNCPSTSRDCAGRLLPQLVRYSRFLRVTLTPSSDPTRKFTMVPAPTALGRSRPEFVDPALKGFRRALPTVRPRHAGTISAPIRWL